MSDDRQEHEEGAPVIRGLIRQVHREDRLFSFLRTTQDSWKVDLEREQGRGQGFGAKSTWERLVKSLSRVRLLATPWTVAYQASPSMGFSRQECWSGLPFPSPGDLPTQESNPGFPHCRQTLYRLSEQGKIKHDTNKRKCVCGKDEGLLITTFRGHNENQGGGEAGLRVRTQV